MTSYNGYRSNIREHLLAAPCANSLIMLYSVRYRAESRIPKPNTKAADVLFSFDSSLNLKARNLGPKCEIFFRFGLELGYIMVCEITLVCVQVRTLILIKELA